MRFLLSIPTLPPVHRLDPLTLRVSVLAMSLGHERRRQAPLIGQNRREGVAPTRIGDARPRRHPHSTGSVDP